MNTNNQLDELKKIRQVDAPPFLLTRIRQQLQSLNNKQAPVKWKWTFAVTIVSLLVLNISLISTKVAFKSYKKNPDTEGIVNALSLSTKNDLYYE